MCPHIDLYAANIFLALKVLSANYICCITCADPGIFARGIQAQQSENSSDCFFLYFQGFRGGPTFSGGGGGGPNANFYRNPYNLWFSREGGSGPPIPLLDPHMYYRMQSNTMDSDQTAALGKQTLWTQIRLLLREQSDLGPYCLQNTLGCISRGQVMG